MNANRNLLVEKISGNLIYVGICRVLPAVFVCMYIGINMTVYNDDEARLVE